MDTLSSALFVWLRTIASFWQVEPASFPAVRLHRRKWGVWMEF
jgi:hypothetical protein